MTKAKREMVQHYTNLSPIDVAEELRFPLCRGKKCIFPAASHVKTYGVSVLHVAASHPQV